MKQKIIIFKKVEELQSFCAEQFIKEVTKNQNSKIGFATGVSPIKAYEKIIADHKENGTSWKNVIAFNLDEFVGISQNHPQAFIKQMKDNLFNYIDIQEFNLNIPNCEAKDAFEEAKKYEKIIRDKGPIDFQYISLGINGHIAYNEPGTNLDSLTHVAKLKPETINDMIQKGKFASIEDAPKEAITMGVKTLLETSKKMMMVSYGKHKAKVTRSMIEDKPNSIVTASALQYHPNCFYVLDEKAASLLSKDTLKRSEFR